MTYSEEAIERDHEEAELALTTMREDRPDIYINTPEESEAALLQIAKHVLAQPERLDMAVWVGECGTSACLAGWAKLLNPRVKKLYPWDAGRAIIPTAAFMFYRDNEDTMEFLRSKLASAGEEQ